MLLEIAYQFLAMLHQSSFLSFMHIHRLEKIADTQQNLILLPNRPLSHCAMLMTPSLSILCHIARCEWRPHPLSSVTLRDVNDALTLYPLSHFAVLITPSPSILYHIARYEWRPHSLSSVTFRGVNNALTLYPLSHCAMWMTLSLSILWHIARCKWRHHPLSSVNLRVVNDALTLYPLSHCAMLMKPLPSISWHNVFSLYDLYDHTHFARNSCPGGHAIYNLVEPSFVIITIYLVCLIHAWEKIRRFLRK